MVPRNTSIYMHDVFNIIRSSWKKRRSPILRTLARYNSIICFSNPSKKNTMSKGFFIVGAVIFALYMYFTIWNIFYSNKKQREENYPDIGKKEQVKLDNKGLKI